MALIVVPVTLREANDFVEQFHRHNTRTQRDGGRFAIAASTGDQLVGVAIVGRPLARMLQDGYTAEVTRLCASPDGPRNVCSFLYGRCWRIWQQMGGRRLVTYTLKEESGASLRACGFKIAGERAPRLKGAWNRDGKEREWQPISGQAKLRWELVAA